MAIFAGKFPFMRLALTALFFLLLVSACVPIRNLVPLQSDDVNRKDLPKDTVVRTRPLSLKEYRIQPQDQLSIVVETLTPDDYNFLKQLNPNVQAMGMNSGMTGNRGMMGYYVDSGGNVDLPVLGQVQLAGQTLKEAETTLQTALKNLLREPVVRVRIMNFRFVFAGEVNGVITSPSPRISFMEALAQAGGFTELSDRANVKIIRQKGEMAEVLYVNLLREETLSSPNFWLQQNDIIIVPPLRQRTARIYATQNVGLFFSLLSLLVATANLITR